MTRPTYRVHLTTHHDGRITGRLLAKIGTEMAPPTAYGRTDDEVLSQLALGIEENVRDRGPFLWTEELSVRKLEVFVHPQTVFRKRVVIGREPLGLQVHYAWAPIASGGYHVLVPALDWMLMIEDLEIAPNVLRQTIFSALLGERAASVYALRDAAHERVVAWMPTLSRAKTSSRFDAGTDRTPVLHQIAEDLVDRERRRAGRRIVGTVDVRAELEAVGGERPRSLLLVGPAGAGKTTRVRVLARELGRREGDERRRLWASSADRIVAGMTYLGMWEKRCLELVAELSGERDLLYFDRLAPLLAPQSGRSSIADLLAPAVLADEVAIISECTVEELQRLSQRAPALLAHFEVIRVEPLAAAAMPAILAIYQTREAPELRIDGAGLRRLVSHLEFFQRDIAFPGKGFRFLDTLGRMYGAGERTATTGAVADPAANQSDEAIPSGTREGDALVLDAAAISEAFAESTGLPLELVSDNHVASREDITRALCAGVIGQDAACSVAARVLTRLKSGLNDPERPIGSLFFVGPTGVGKTELAKQLARYMFGDADRMLRFDMSEYMLSGAAQRLLATGRGVRSLVERLRERPLSLLLFDEIEKAHPEVFDLLLGLLGEGRLTDVDGRLVDGRMTLVVMTSNIGIRTTARPGFADDDGDGRDLATAVRAHFRPEFFNRIDHVIPFRTLDHADIRRIVELELDKLAARTGFGRRRIRLHVSNEVRDVVARAGWHPTRGARPLKRVIEERLVAPIAGLLAEDPTLVDVELRVLTHDEAAGTPARSGRIILGI